MFSRRPCLTAPSPIAQASEIARMPQAPASIISWRIETENQMCISLSEVYYDHLCRPSSRANSLNFTQQVLSDERVKSIRAGDRLIKTAVVVGEQSPGNADLVAWSPARTQAA
mmetsp:Transcript_62663/g.123773  ORF Transcript_62663/g.123773 Transcript_62663/m.123773 type:complete len:113 (+) Transcript_62663:1492-1830(+)